MHKWIAPAAVALLSILITSSSSTVAQSPAQSPGSFEKKAYNYAEWTKGKFSEAMVVSNPGRHIFVGGTGAEGEEDGKIKYPGDFYGQCKYTFMKIKKVLALHGATLKDVVKMTIFVSDMRFFLTDWVKCRGEEYAGTGADLPASALIGVSSFARPHMLLEIQTEAMVAK
jgi:enamine deaminase RidA (YjgF/YER057c/UK114 family)